MAGTRNKFEEKIGISLTKRAKITGCTVLYEPEKLAYELKKTYTPDWVITFPSGIKRYIETKGYFRPEDRTKILSVLRHHPDIDLRLVFQRDNFLNKGSKTRYSDWAKQHGVTFALGTIPTAWMREDG